MQEAFFQAALEKGYFNNPKLRASVKKLAVQQYVRDLLNERSAGKICAYQKR